MPAPKSIKKNGVTLQSSDQCPRCAPHLVSDHDEAKANQCSRCACVIQSVANHVGTRIESR